jgi:hypothetical protein
MVVRLFKINCSKSEAASMNDFFGMVGGLLSASAPPQDDAGIIWI